MVRRLPRPRAVLIAAAPAVVLAAAVAVAAGTSRTTPPPAGAAPPARVLSRYETAASGNAIDRDCGFSAPLPGRPGGSVWLFCDTVWTGARRGLWLGATAATGPAVPGRVPTGLTELPTPAGAGIAAASSPRGPGAAPQGFLGTPPGLVLPGGAPCRVPGTAYSASWVSGAARPPGTGALLVAYTDVCVHGTTISTQGFGLVEYRPGENALTGRARVFSLPAGLPFQQNLGSPVFSGGYLYLFASVCDAHGPGACLGGRVTLARVRADPSAWRDPAAYEYRTGGGWTRDAFQAGTVVAGAAPYAVHVADYTALGRGLVMVEQRGLDGRFRLWRAPAPEGPWRAAGDGIVPCSGGSGLDQCRALIGHPGLSTRGALLLSYYDPAADHVTVRAVPW
ncbi:DUF4185 domain-containing protein [Actinomadura madurae]|uniref:DUF4185 domain-containing protein n=1 Tax=Actinomadura madurae TaxID=1993 RepID=UPI002026AC2D|nr:DUF4185 domain-containing protein [Actinomadura madurae]URM93401.1 DUF4185 domain-containing protein [Actinomadura madurae]URN04131.1 DUF4185 domain-containing protein [Actinomadura madurae]